MDLELAVRLSVKDLAQFKSAMREASGEASRFGRGGGGRNGLVDGAGGGGRGRGRREVELGKQVDRVGARIHHTGLAMERSGRRTGAALMGVVEPALDYEKAIVDAVAVTGDAVGDATGKNEQRLRDLTRGFGSMGYAAEEVAEAVGYMGMAGMRTDQIMGSMAPTLKLAKAASLDLARTTDLSTDIMTAFALKSGNVAEAQQSMTRVADVMTHTFTSSNTTLSLASASMFKIGNLAVQAGLSIESVAGAVGQLGSAGIKGGEAGTAIRNMLLRLTNPTKAVRDTFKMLRLDIDDVTDAIAQDDLPRALKMFDAAIQKKDLSEAQRLKAFGTVFGARAASAGAYLTSTAASGALGNQIAATRNSAGTSERIANKKLDSDPAKVAAMKAELEQMQIDLGTKVLPGLMPVAREIVDGLQELAEFAEKHPAALSWAAKWLATMAVVTMVTGPAVTAVGGLVRMTGGLISMANAGTGATSGTASALGSLGSAAGGASGKLSKLSGFLGSAGLVAAAGAAGVAVGTLVDEWLGISDRLSGANSGKDDSVDAPWWTDMLGWSQDYKGSGAALAGKSGAGYLTAEEQDKVSVYDQMIAEQRAKMGDIGPESEHEKMAKANIVGKLVGAAIPTSDRVLEARAAEAKIEELQRKKAGVAEAARARSESEAANVEKYRDAFKARFAEGKDMRNRAMLLNEQALGAKKGKRGDAIRREAALAREKLETFELQTSMKASRLGIGLDGTKAFEDRGKKVREKFEIDVTVRKDFSVDVKAKAAGDSLNPDSGSFWSS